MIRRAGGDDDQVDISRRQSRIVQSEAGGFQRQVGGRDVGFGDSGARECPYD